MRLFVALDISDDVRRRARALINRIDRRIAARKGRAGQVRITWTAAERLHLTVQFLGDVDEAMVPAIEQRIAPPFEGPPFEIALGGLGMFPASGPPRVLWVGVTEGLARTHEVFRETVRRLDGAGLRLEARPYSAHLTLGRVRTAGARLRHDLEALRHADLGRCTIDHVTLYQSRLSPKGPTYIARLQVPLC